MSTISPSYGVPLPPAPTTNTAPASLAASLPEMPSLDALKGLDHYAGVRMGVSSFGTYTRGAGARRGAGLSSRSAGALGVGSVVKATGAAALFAVPLAVATNFLDWRAGKITERQRNILMGADAAGYTVAGAGGTLVGAAIGASLLGPALGLGVGLVASVGLGFVYEKYLRPRFLTLGLGEPAPVEPKPEFPSNPWEPK